MMTVQLSVIWSHFHETLARPITNRFFSSRFLNICSHSVAIAKQEGILQELIKEVRVTYQSAMTYPANEGGAGRKGGWQRKKRVYLSEPEVENPSKRTNSSPFSQIWHNNEPLYL